MAHGTASDPVATQLGRPLPDPEHAPEHNVEILAAFTAGMRIESAIFLPAFAFNMANAVIVGNLLGERKDQEAYRSGLVTAGIGVAVVSALTILVILNARWIAHSLSDNESW